MINYTRGNITVASALPNITDKRRMLPPLSDIPTCFVNRKSMGKKREDFARDANAAAIFEIFDRNW